MLNIFRNFVHEIDQYFIQIFKAYLLFSLKCDHNSTNSFFEVVFGADGKTVDKLS